MVAPGAGAAGQHQDDTVTAQPRAAVTVLRVAPSGRIVARQQPGSSLQHLASFLSFSTS